MKQFINKHALFLVNLASITYGSVILGVHFHSVWVGGAVWNIAYALLPRQHKSTNAPMIVLELKGAGRGTQETSYTSPKSVC